MSNEVYPAANPTPQFVKNAVPKPKPKAAANGTTHPPKAVKVTTVGPKTRAATGALPEAAKEMGKPRLRILLALADAGRPLDRKEIAAAANVDRAWITEWVGANDDEVRARNDQKAGSSLITLGYVKHNQEPDADGKAVWVYAITGKGRALAERVRKAQSV